MSTFVHSFSSRSVLCIDHSKYETIRDLKMYLSETKGIPLDASFFICNGGLVNDDEPVKKNVVYHTYLRILGGKGGFGSMLRAIGAQIEKTTNHEACRDLSGRRMRDVNNEKDLKDWLAKQTEREKEKEVRRQERLARRRAMPNHKFEDPLYDKQRALLAENQDDALQTGLKKFQPVAGPSSTVTSEDMVAGKRKSATRETGSKKKKTGTEWLGIDVDNLSDLESEDDDDSGSNEASGGINPAFTSNEAASGETNVASTSQSNDSENSCNSSDNVEVCENKRDPIENNCSSDSTNITNSDNQTDRTETKLSSPETTKQINTENGGVKSVDSSEVQAVEDEPFCLDEVTSVQDVELLGLERLKAELMSRGLKCGGTLEQRAQRLFSVKGLTREQIDPALFAKSTDGKNVKKKK